MMNCGIWWRKTTFYWFIKKNLKRMARIFFDQMTTPSSLSQKKTKITKRKEISIQQNKEKNYD